MPDKIAAYRVWPSAASTSWHCMLCNSRQEHICYFGNTSHTLGCSWCMEAECMPQVQASACADTQACAQESRKLRPASLLEELTTTTKERRFKQFRTPPKGN